jgi:AcrR family transcriptional regulator
MAASTASSRRFDYCPHKDRSSAAGRLGGRGGLSRHRPAEGWSGGWVWQRLEPSRSGAVGHEVHYAQFGGKDALVAAYLADRHERWMRRWDNHIHAARTPADRLTAIFDALAEWAREDGLVRGCAFSDAAAEITDRTHPAWDVITTHKRALHHRLRELAEQAELDAPDDAATDLLLIYEGALVGCLLGHLDAPIDHAKTLAMRVVASRRVPARPAGGKRPHAKSR